MPSSPEKQKQRYEANKERILAQHKEYRAANKAARLLKRQQKINCECGKEIMEHSKTKHLRSKFHAENVPHQ